ncbi:MAG: hypothetical protein MGF17_09655 [Trichodesmium sp. MAG_R04]|nr:hypothetical protein [Trichodesmium sp. MAG_R04]
MYFLGVSSGASPTKVRERVGLLNPLNLNIESLNKLQPSNSFRRFERFWHG